jgi:hypothetical protein
MSHLIGDKVLDTLENFRLSQRRRADQRKLAAQADLQYIKKIESAKVQNIKRNVRSDVPSNTKTWVIDNFGVEGLKNYNRWLKKGNKELNLERGEVGKELPRKIAAAVEHTTSLAGDPSKQDLKPNPLVDSYKDPETGEYKPVTQRGADDPTAKFIGSSYRNLHQNKYDAYTKQQIEELGIPDNWAKSAAYFFATDGKGVDKLSHNDWMALQSGEISAEELASGKRVQDTDVAGKIKEIHKVEEGVSIKNRWDPESTHYKKLSPKQREIVELGYVDPDKMVTTKLNPETEIKIPKNTPTIEKAKTPKDVFFNVARTGAKVAGQSPNPFANIAGDVIGAAMDTAVYISNPKDKDALADLTLSGSQAIISVGAGLVALLPVPGARPGAYALVQLGDNIGKVEKIWNMTREGRQIAKNYKAGKNTKLEGGKSKPNVVSKQSGQEISEIKKDFQFDTKLKNLSKLKI